MNAAPIDLSRETCGDVADRFQATLRERSGLLLLLLFGLNAALLAIGAPQMGPLLLITVGALVPVWAWMRCRQPGLPLIVAMAIQTYAVFALPIITRNEVLQNYAPEDILSASLEVLYFSLALAAGWLLVEKSRRRQAFIPAHWKLSILDLEKPDKLSRFTIGLFGFCAIYALMSATRQLAEFESMLQFGILSLLRSAMESGALVGALLGGFLVGGGLMRTGQRYLFWGAFIVFSIAKVSSVLLSSALGVVAALILGHLLGARRPPWRFIVIVFSLTYFLNLGKFEMRGKYWEEHGFGTGVTLSEMPAYFAEWAQASSDALNKTTSLSDEEEKKAHLLTDRLNNLQNLLFAQNAIRYQNLPLLLGETYAAVPALLIPRALWKNKPRTHEGQILLNVHFGRQELESTFTTYIAWGLLAEAYGNFGPFWGAVICGLVLGLSAAALERWIRPYPLTSLETVFCLLVIVSFCLSFEMVASVWITSLFQMLVALMAAVALFAVKRRRQASQQP